MNPLPLLFNDKVALVISSVEFSVDFVKICKVLVRYVKC